jgi:phosphatidylserine/phosphatidylglycerophosphate/cardiolipin synthase-like enzyme
MKAFGKRLRWPRIIVLAAAVALLGTAWWHSSKSLPPGLHVESPLQAVPAASVQLLSDISAINAYGEPVTSRVIHGSTLDLIRKAHDFLVLDYFLFNEQGGPAGPLAYGGGIRPVAREMRDALLALHASQPNLPILLLVDPINNYYRGSVPAELQELKAAGIHVVSVKLDVLRDSNLFYSAAWRLLVSWWLPRRAGHFDNPLNASGPALPLWALLRIPNFKADHRKVIITGDGAGSLLGIVSSANPHDASSAHSNVALRLHGEALRALLDSEMAIARFSGWRDQAIAAAAGRAQAAATAAPVVDEGTRVGIVTEGAIRTALLKAVDPTQRGDSIDVAQFYLTDRPVIDALLAAAKRGVAVRIVLDPNKDAFGFEKDGIPNREVASELVAASDGAIKLRWYRTHGEQFHTKLASIHHAGHLWLMLGSANFTRRNIADYNLEADAIVVTPVGSALDDQVSVWFETLWTNRPGGIEYTADTDVYADPSQLRYWLYRFMEASGMSTF